MSCTNRGAVRATADFYPTPLSAFDVLIPFLDRTRHHWEPACGDGRLVLQMRMHGIRADGADLEQDALLKGRIDYLKDTTQYDVVLTNPPYSLAQEFIEHGLAHSKEMWLLLRLNFLGSIKRGGWWMHGRNPNALFILTQRPRFAKNKHGKIGSDGTEYAWFYWGRRYDGIFQI